MGSYFSKHIFLDELNLLTAELRTWSKEERGHESEILVDSLNNMAVG